MSSGGGTVDVGDWGAAYLRVAFHAVALIYVRPLYSRVVKSI